MAALAQSLWEPSAPWLLSPHSPHGIQCPAVHQGHKPRAVMVGLRDSRLEWKHWRVTDVAESPGRAGRSHGWRSPLPDCSFVTLHYLIDNLSCHSRQRRAPVRATVCSLSHSQFPNPIYQLYSYFMNHTLGPN